MGWKRWAIVVLAVLLGAGSLWVVWMAYRQWTFQPTGQIAYVCPGTRRDNNGYVLMQICLINADGSGRRQITDLTDHASTPAWSPDGQRLIFKAGWRIAILNLGQTSAIDYIDLKGDPTLFAKWPRWSPDGSQLIFVGLVSDQRVFDLYIANIDGSNVKKLVSDVNSAPASWSPDGQWIAYTDVSRGATSIISHDGSRQRQLDGLCVFQNWSPDSSAIACRSNAIWIVKADGSGSSNIKNCFFYILDCDSVSWSPDGQYLTYSQRNWRYFMDTGGEIWLSSADGVVSRLLVREQQAREPAWRP